MKLSATAKIAIKSAYDYLQACQHPEGVTIWFRENFKSGDDHLALTTRVKIAKHNWNHLFNMGFSSSDIIALYREVYPNENNSPESTCKRTKATIYMCVAVFGFIGVLVLLEHFSIDKVV